MSEGFKGRIVEKPKRLKVSEKGNKISKGKIIANASWRIIENGCAVWMG
jgi:hypothetical protein